VPARFDGALKRPQLRFTAVGLKGRQFKLQTKLEGRWRDQREGEWHKPDGAATIRLPASWYTRARSAWRLVFPASAGQPTVITPARWVYRTPYYEPVNCRKVKCAALTFDDGPGPGTAQLLDILRRRKAPATFFLLGGQAAAYPQIVRRQVREGHEVESHTYSHPNLNSLSGGAIADQMSRSAKAITKAAGVAPHLMRPPYGNADGHVRSALAAKGYPLINWSVDTRDWEHRNPAKTLAHVHNDTSAGAIILMHDIHPTTIAAVNACITDLRKRGFTLVTVEDLLGKHLTAGQVYYNR
jgi:peptidoglycan/xylan/chitin deacetylase (PgdA/CDA1 family)